MVVALRLLLATVLCSQGTRAIDASNRHAPPSNTAAKDSVDRNLIVNGNTVSNPSDYQFFVRSWPDSVRQTPDMICGASLIHEDIILTAAHCQGAFNYGAMLFNPFTESFTWFQTVDRQIAHPDYYQDLQLINGDVMILRLSEPVTNIQPVLLNNDPSFPVPEVDVAHATGFGLTDFNGFISDTLQVGYFHAISNASCLQRGRFVNVVITSNVMCVDPATDDSVCGGDSGGPLTVPLVQAEEQQGGGGDVGSLIGGSGGGAVQVGIISFGTVCTADAIPDGMTRVSYYYDWITEQVCRHSRNPPSDCPSEFYTTTPEEALLDQGRVEVRLDFHHDFLAEQTTFAVRNVQSDEIEYVGPQYVPRRGDKVSSTFRMFPGVYRFEVYDAGNDGLRNPIYVNENYPQGSWTLSAVYPNGAATELATGDENYESIQVSFFTVPDEAPPTDTSLTEPPTISPSSSPSTSPTASPTAAATTADTPLEDNETEDAGDDIADSNTANNGGDLAEDSIEGAGGTDASGADAVSLLISTVVSFCIFLFIR